VVSAAPEGEEHDYRKGDDRVRLKIAQSAARQGQGGDRRRPAMTDY
jgi:hypothetical protein